MSDDAPKTDGWLQSLRRMGVSALGLVQCRIELFAIELQEQQLRAVSALTRVLVALTLVAVGLLVLLGTVAVYLWNLAGYWGLLGLALACIGAGGGVLWLTYQRIKGGPTPFSETIAEFRKDRDCLQGVHRSN